MSHLWFDIFYDSPCKKLFSDLYLFKFEHHFENKKLFFVCFSSFLFEKNFLGFSRNFFTQSWVSKVCNTTLWMDPSKICSAFQVIDIPICHYNVISLPRQGINQHSFVLNFPLFLDSKIAFCTRWRSALPHIVEDIAQWTKTWKTIVIFIQQFRLNYSVFASKAKITFLDFKKHWFWSLRYNRSQYFP